jgi:hypothetical protein
VLTPLKTESGSPKKEYFSSEQFDEIVRTMKVKLRDKNRYEFLHDYRTKASQRSSGVIVFDKEWFCRLGPKAKCAVLTHELWHLKTRTESVIRFISFAALGLVMVFSIWGFGLWIAISYGSYEGFPLWMLSIGFIWVFWMFVVSRRISYVLEFISDEASVRYFGVEATREYLGSLKDVDNGGFFPSHPPNEERLKKVEMVGRSYEKPLIDFDDLGSRYPFVVCAD